MDFEDFFKREGAAAAFVSRNNNRKRRIEEIESCERETADARMPAAFGERAVHVEICNEASVFMMYPWRRFRLG